MAAKIIISIILVLGALMMFMNEVEGQDTVAAAEAANRIDDAVANGGSEYENKLLRVKRMWAPWTYASDFNRNRFHG